METIDKNTRAYVLGEFGITEERLQELIKNSSPLVKDIKSILENGVYQVFKKIYELCKTENEKLYMTYYVTDTLTKFGVI